MGSWQCITRLDNLKVQQLVVTNHRRALQLPCFHKDRQMIPCPCIHSSPFTHVFPMLSQTRRLLRPDPSYSHICHWEALQLSSSPELAGDPLFPHLASPSHALVMAIGHQDPSLIFWLPNHTAVIPVVLLCRHQRNKNSFHSAIICQGCNTKCSTIVSDEGLMRSSCFSWTPVSQIGLTDHGHWQLTDREGLLTIQWFIHQTNCSHLMHSLANVVHLHLLWTVLKCWLWHLLLKLDQLTLALGKAMQVRIHSSAIWLHSLVKFFQLHSWGLFWNVGRESRMNNSLFCKVVKWG